MNFVTREQPLQGILIRSGDVLEPSCTQDRASCRIMALGQMEIRDLDQVTRRLPCWRSREAAENPVAQDQVERGSSGGGVRAEHLVNFAGGCEGPARTLVGPLRGSGCSSTASGRRATAMRAG
ncbi:hypothetical protein Q5P01_000103 [Channa striata]|uniref:Uncharacterized protein n=1 Tax=Channa striata TaxID=64152 RepID=A0AA88LMT8_CHASR|nr:hypothetical protein Q5P01_000103 [Channa striata]